MSKFISLRTCIKIHCGDNRCALESFFQEWFSSSWLRWHFRERVRDKHKIIPQVVSSNLTESLLSKFCVNTHKGYHNASYEKFYHPFQTSRSHWHFCCHHTDISSIFTGVWWKFLITLNQRRVDRNQKGAKSSSYSPPWPASSGGTTEVKFQSIWQTVLSLTPPESRR